MRLNAIKHVVRPTFWVGVGLGCSLTLAVCELPYINWQSSAPLVMASPLVIWHDAKGDGRFASRRSGGRRHRGIDLVAPLESPVYAVRSGRVVQVGDHKGFGHFIEIEHGSALRSLYAHLNAVEVATGARVRQGERIGRVGKTGNARHPWITPHLHLEIVRDGRPVNPQEFSVQAVEPLGAQVAQTRLEAATGGNDE